MSAQYPGALKSFSNPLSSDNLNSPPHATQHADANDEIVAIETELGINPKGGYATVKARLDALGSVPTNTQVFTSTSTWTKPAEISRVYVRVWGAGGGGGGASNTGAALAGYGGNGGYSEGYVTVTTDITVTVGAGGAAGVSNGDGANGGTSSFAAAVTIQATGGTGGLKGASGTNGAGGTGSGGQINFTPYSSTAIHAIGERGTTPNGGGTAAGAGLGYSAGGGPGYKSGTGGGFGNGGAGAAGLVIVSY